MKTSFVPGSPGRSTFATIGCAVMIPPVRKRQRVTSPGAVAFVIAVSEALK